MAKVKRALTEEQIELAIAATYGAGIDPSKVKELRDTLKRIYGLLDSPPEDASVLEFYNVKINSAEVRGIQLLLNETERII